jgi:hypothetical protein
VLVQLLLPAAAPADDERVARTRAELTEAFGGLTAYVRTPAHGVWTAPDGTREHDEMVMVEVVAAEFDRDWWRGYATTLADRFEQTVIHVRAMDVDLLDDEA